MRHWKLAPLALALLGLASPAVAQRRVDLSVEHGRGITLNAQAGRFGVSFGRTSSIRPRNGYVSSRRVSCPTPQRVYVKGYWKTVDEKVWVPATKRRVWREPVYQTRYDSCGRAYQVLVRPGCYEWITEGGHWAVQPKRVWVPGHWTYRN